MRNASPRCLHLLQPDACLAVLSCTQNNLTDVLQLGDEYNLPVVHSATCSFLRYNASELTFTQPITSARNPLRAYTLVEMYLSDKAGPCLVAIEKAAKDKLAELADFIPATSYLPQYMEKCSACSGAKNLLCGKCAVCARNSALHRSKGLAFIARHEKTAELLSVKALVSGLLACEEPCAAVHVQPSCIAVGLTQLHLPAT